MVFKPKKMVVPVALVTSKVGMPRIQSVSLHFSMLADHIRFHNSDGTSHKMDASNGDNANSPLHLASNESVMHRGRGLSDSKGVSGRVD